MLPQPACGQRAECLLGAGKEVVLKLALTLEMETVAQVPWNGGLWREMGSL